jgi:hypothetical protein
MTSLGTSLAGGCYLGISPQEVPVASTCDRERFWGEVSLWDEALGWRCCLARGTGCPIKRGISSALVKMSSSVTLRTDTFYGLGLRKPCSPLAFMGKRRMYD